MKIVWRCPLWADWSVDQGKSASIPMNEPKTDTRYRWVIVAAGGLLGCVAIGSMFSLPVFLLPIARDTGWSVSGVSTSMTIAFLAMALGSVSWGALSDRMWPRFVVLAGAVGLPQAWHGRAGRRRCCSFRSYSECWSVAAPRRFSRR